MTQPALLIVAILFLPPLAPSRALGQSCTVAIPTVTHPGSGTLCANGLWVVEGNEISGPHAGQLIDYGQFNMAGVCYYSYLGCTVTTPDGSLTLQEENPTSTVSKNVNAGQITVVVTTLEPQATNNPTPCKCSDPSPSGYTGVYMLGDYSQTVKFYANC
jgi:hypothetical protein